MPEIDLVAYGKKVRPDGKLGHIFVTPTVMRFYETDGTDVRLDRVRIFDEKNELTHSFLMDKMGVPFVDNLPGAEDDMAYLERLRTLSFI